MIQAACEIVWFNASSEAIWNKSFELIPSRVQKLASTLPDCWAGLPADLQGFCQFLTAINEG